MSGTSEQTEAITGFEAPIYLNYRFTAGEATSRFLSELKEGKIVGQRCPSCKNVYVPPRGSCAKCGVATEEEVEVSDKGTVMSFTIVHIPIPGNPIKPPYVVANIILDGSDITFIHLISGAVPNEDVHIGMRVAAVWKPKEEWDYTMENIAWFEPIDEPDVDVDKLREQAKCAK